MENYESKNKEINTSNRMDEKKEGESQEICDYFCLTTRVTS